jgi:hypothetical protein
MSPSSRKLFGFLVLLISALEICQARVFVLSGASNGTEFESAQFYRKGQDFSQTFEPLSGILVDYSNEDIAGKIAYFTVVPPSHFYPTIFELRDRGVIGVVYGAGWPVPGQDFCFWTGEDMSQIQFPVTEVRVGEFDAIHQELLEGAEIEIHMTSEGNPWLILSGSVTVTVIFRVLLGGYALAMIIFGLYKLILFIKHQGPHFNIPQVCLALEIIANMWRVIYLVIDPLGCQFVYGSAANSFLDSVSIPYTTATFVILTFYWHEIVSDASIAIYPFLSKLKIPFFVIMLLLIAMDMTLSLVGYFYDLDTTTSMSVIYIVISFGFLIFYVISLVKVMKRMRTSKDLRGKQKRKFKFLSKVNAKMIFNGVTRFGVVVVGIAYAFPSVNSYPVQYVVIWAFLYFILISDSLARNILFDISSHSSSSKKSRSDSKLSETGTGTGKLSEVTNTAELEQSQAVV